MNIQEVELKLKLCQPKDGAPPPPPHTYDKPRLFQSTQCVISASEGKPYGWEVGHQQSSNDCANSHLLAQPSHNGPPRHQFAVVMKKNPVGNLAKQRCHAIYALGDKVHPMVLRGLREAVATTTSPWLPHNKLSLHNTGMLMHQSKGHYTRVVAHQSHSGFRSTTVSLHVVTHHVQGVSPLVPCHLQALLLRPYLLGQGKEMHAEAVASYA